MPRLKRRETDRGLFTAETLKMAILEVMEKGRPIRAVGRDYNINRMTLTCYLKEKNERREKEKHVKKKSRVTTQVRNILQYVLI